MCFHIKLRSISSKLDIIKCFQMHLISTVPFGDDNEPIKCKFPPWSTSGAVDAEDDSLNGLWESFSLTSKYSFTLDGGRLIVSNFSHLGLLTQQVSLTR